MDGPTLRLAVGGLVGVVALCIIGVVAVVSMGRDITIIVLAIAPLGTLAGTGLGILGTLLLPSGRMPNGNGAVQQPGPPTVPFQPPVIAGDGNATHRP